MKQLPRISALLYGTPWAIVPADHAELGKLYQSYLTGNLPVPQSIAADGEACYGVSWFAEHTQQLATVHLEGIISKRAPEMMCGPPVVDLSKLDAVLDELAADEAMQTIIFDFNSPGGIIIGLKETAERMRELSLMGRRLIAYTDYQMCSAAYYLAAACDEIYAAPTSVIGSIGTYCAGLDDSRAWEMEGLELVLAKSGDLKAMGHPGKKWSEEEKQHLQGQADKAGAQFRAWISSRRGAIEESAMQGQWFFAEDAPARLHDGLYRDLPALRMDLMP